MDYRRLGEKGLKVSEIGFGSWVTFGESLDLNQVKWFMRKAFDEGVNFFDNAEIYGNGAAELLMGEAIRDLPREELVVTTKIFWGGQAPNTKGLSRKHVLEGAKNSLRRMQLDYVDLIYCHRPDPETPIEETVSAMDYLVRHGFALYWGTSEWSAEQIERAHQIAIKTGKEAPVVEQPEYNLLRRDRVEVDYKPLIEKYRFGLTTWSPLAQGILTGKYNKGIPENARFSRHPEFAGKLTQENIGIVKRLEEVSKELGCSLANLSLAWCLKNPDVSSVITGATTEKQLEENVQASQVKSKLTDEIMLKIQTIIK